MEETTKTGMSAFMGFLLGGAVGAGIALLYAPTSGVETRRKLRESADRARQRTKEGYDATLEKIEGKYDTVKTAVLEKKDAVKAAYEAGKEAYQEKVKQAA